MSEVKEGSKVKVHYTGSLDDGQVFDTSEGRDPIEFTVGENKVIKGFEQGVMGMKAGEEKTVKIKPEDAYGERQDKMILEVPKEVLKLPKEPQIGMVLALHAEDGREFRAIITKVGDHKVTVDMNHPLAGKTLNFKLKVEEVN